MLQKFTKISTRLSQDTNQIQILNDRYNHQHFKSSQVIYERSNKEIERDIRK